MSMLDNSPNIRRNVRALPPSRAIAPPVTSPEIPTHIGAQGITLRAEWSTLAQVTALGAGGLLLLSVANYVALRGNDLSTALFWLGLAALFLPFALRLVSPAPSRTERIVLLVELALALYLVKIMHSPVAFTFPDEFIHLFNLNAILSSHHLFTPNSILPATPSYPGVEIVTAAVVQVTGLSAYQAGLLVIGIARIIILLSLFLLFEQLSGSARVASLGAVLFTANSEYLFWSAQFAYESLALPLAVLFLFLVRQREQTTDARLTHGLTIAALLTLSAVIVTHHLTAYALVGILWTWVFVEHVLRVKVKNGVAIMAIIATVATLAWLFLVANATFGYLFPVFRDAVQGLIHLAAAPSSGRQLFQSNTGDVAPLWDRFVALGSVVVILLLLPFGLLRFQKVYFGRPFVFLLALASFAYPLLLVLRFARNSWEIANRASEYVFIGAAFIIAIGIVQFSWSSVPVRLRRSALLEHAVAFLQQPVTLALIAVLLFMGGVVAGWAPNGRLAHPFNVATNSQQIYPQGIAAAQWTHEALGANNRIAADYSNARLQLAYGQQAPLSGNANGIQLLMNAEQIDRGMREIIATNRIAYTLVDRRRASSDPLLGLYFSTLLDADTDSQYLDPVVYAKFDREPHVSRLFDSGDIHIYSLNIH